MNFFQMLSDNDKAELRGLVSEAVAETLVKHGLIKITPVDAEPWRCTSTKDGLRCNTSSRFPHDTHSAFDQNQQPRQWTAETWIKPIETPRCNLPHPSRKTIQCYLFSGHAETIQHTDGEGNSW